MKLLQKLAFLAAACALLVATFSIIGPRAVKAAVATLVQVVNTPASPVPNADVNAPGEEPFQTQLCFSLGSNVCPTSPPGDFVVPATTSDGVSIKRLVIEHISARCQTSGNFARLETTLFTQMNENQVNGAAFPGAIYLPLTVSSPGSGGGLNPVSSIPVRAYADPGTTVYPFLAYEGLPGGGDVNVQCNYTIVGSYVTH